MKNFIEVTVSSSPVLVSVSAITDVWPRELGGGTDIYTRSEEGAYIHATESYDDIKRMIRVAMGEDEEPRPIYYRVSDNDWPRLRARLERHNN